MKKANKYFEHVANVFYVGMTETNQNYIQEELREQIQSEEFLLSFNSEYSRLLCNNVPINIYNTIIAK